MRLFQKLRSNTSVAVFPTAGTENVLVWDGGAWTPFMMLVKHLQRYETWAVTFVDFNSILGDLGGLAAAVIALIGIFVACPCCKKDSV